ncbi:hypothetical protein KKG48_00455, partial [Patescibacteria group bacterium]|nr:hypothetical protein [Patescibacteria group bacterium]
MERTFFFSGFCPPSIRAVRRGFNSDSAKRKNYFLWERIFRFASANLFLHFVRAEEGVWGRNPRGLLLIFLARTA